MMANTRRTNSTYEWTSKRGQVNLAQTSPLYDAKLLSHASPLGWEHVILSGDFDWHSGAADRKIARPLNIRPTRNWGT